MMTQCQKYENFSYVNVKIQYNVPKYWGQQILSPNICFLDFVCLYLLGCLWG